MNLTEGSIVAGKFRLERPLAKGGMGSVWVGFNTQLEMPVALKFMAPAMVGSPDLVARFEREAKAAAQLRNPHVVQIFEYGVDRETPFIAMELLEGEDLGARLRSRGRLSLQETARILGDVCKALQSAHKNRVVHRDLKPANVFLCKHDEYEVVKVLDFGIAKVVGQRIEDDVTRTGALVGSPHYMAPEQARRTNKAVDHRSDLWSLGVIAFRCATGQLPFAGDDLIDVLVRVCTVPAPTPSSFAPDLSPEVDRFFARALARDPDLRFQSAKEMADALNRLAGIEAAPAMDRSWSDGNPQGRWSSPDLGAPHARAPEPRPSQPSRAEIVDEGSDDARTLPIQSFGLQKVMEARPWANGPVQLPPEYANLSPNAKTLPLPRQAGPTGPMAGPGPGPLASPTFAVPPGSLPAHVEAHAAISASRIDGTLTSAGTEVLPRATAKREKPWVILAAVGAALVVVGVIVAALFLGVNGDGAAASGEEVVPLWTSPSTSAAGSGETSPSAPPTASAPPPATGSVPGAMSAVPTASATPSGTARAAATATSTAKAVAPAVEPDEDEEARRALVGAGTAAPRPKPTATAAPAPVKSDYLKKTNEL